MQLIICPHCGDHNMYTTEQWGDATWNREHPHVVCRDCGHDFCVRCRANEQGGLKGKQADINPRKIPIQEKYPF